MAVPDDKPFVSRPSPLEGTSAEPSGPTAETSASIHIAVDVQQLVIRNSVQVRTNGAVPRTERHYVLIIHGTFSNPEFQGHANWFYPDPDKSSDNFCTHLSNLLADGELGAESVWRTLPDADQLPSGVKYPFYWDGTNTDQGRKDGAWYLAKLIRHIANRDPAARVHLIAHSHGGNVALKAIEQYVRKLKPESAEEDWPQEVREAFRVEHQAQADEIARWRRVEGVAWWGWLNPFLVVWRERKGETNVEERYPWGYHRSVDSLLGLGKRRKKQYLGNRRMTSPISNALGKVIFLGTPFYYKQWAKWAALKMLFSLFVSFVLGFVLTWCAVGLWNVAIDKRADRNVVVYISLGLSGAIFLANLPTLFANMLLRNGNMYHSDKVPWSPAQAALVIQAGKLDEAALALCAEPAARAFLLPLVRRATAHVGFLPLLARPAARPGARARALAWSLYLLALFRVVVLDAYLLVPRVLFWLISKVVVMHTFAMVRNVVVGMSFGLDTSNLKNASVYVEEALVLGKGARDIRTWDVRRLLAEAEAGAASQSWGADALGSRGVGEKGLGGQGLGKQKLGGKGLSDSGLGERELGDQTAQSLTGRRSDDVAQGGDGGERGAVGSNGRFAPESGSEGGCPTGSEKVVQTGMLPEIEKSGSDAATFQRASGPNAGGSKSKTTDQGGLVKGVQEGPQASESAFSFLWDDDELRTRSDTSVMFNQLRSQMPRIDHSPRLSRAEFARELRSICCVFEMRFWEIRNHFQLAHATYYKNSVIVGAMVRFLNDLELPSEHY